MKMKPWLTLAQLRCHPRSSAHRAPTSSASRCIFPPVLALKSLERKAALGGMCELQAEQGVVVNKSSPGFGGSVKALSYEMSKHPAPLG